MEQQLEMVDEMVIFKANSWKSSSIRHPAIGYAQVDRYGSGGEMDMLAST